MEDHEDDDDLIIPSRRVPSTYVGSNCSDKKQFRVMSLNVQSMNNKFDTIRLLAETTGAPILALQETWGRNPTTEYSIKPRGPPGPPRRLPRRRPEEEEWETA